MKTRRVHPRGDSTSISAHPQNIRSFRFLKERARRTALLSSPLYSRVWLQLPLRRARVLHILDVQFARTSEQQLGYFKAISLLEY